MQTGIRALIQTLIQTVVDLFLCSGEQPSVAQHTRHMIPPTSKVAVAAISTTYIIILYTSRSAGRLNSEAASCCVWLCASLGFAALT